MVVPPTPGSWTTGEEKKDLESNIRQSEKVLRGRVLFRLNDAGHLLSGKVLKYLLFLRQKGERWVAPRHLRFVRSYFSVHGPEVLLENVQLVFLMLRVIHLCNRSHASTLSGTMEVR